MLYTDTQGCALCIGPEEDGETFCGGYDATRPITDTVDSVWELFDGDTLHDSCSCREDLIEYLGFEDEEELEQFRRKRRTRRILAEKQGGD